jgi:adenine-specific DNA-methyltransferase
MAAAVAELKVAYDNQQLIHNHSAWSFVPWHYLTGVRNKSIKKSARYEDENPSGLDLPSRKSLEEISRRFNVKYLLAVLNSSFARDFLRSNRRSNIHLYPEDWKKLPIASIAKSQQQPIVRLVEKMLDAKKESAVAEDDYDKRRLNQFCADLDHEIDHLVNKLYGLTDVEIGIVEGIA